ncbi:MAG TPA: pitrilysin family protein [Clostridia bacterium]|nr:pitrilysin family protein [Clostridia bacterium]
MYKKTVLKNGLRIVSEKIPHVRSVSVGIWIGTGSRDENLENNGISHFIEHMMFKGTEKRSAKDIAESIDNIGGQLNAFTGKECTCYYTKTLDTHLDISFDVLSDMLFNSKFSAKDIDIERKVILEEIGMYQDNPEELVHDVLIESAWDGNSLGYSILGTQNSLDKIDRKIIKSYIKNNYTPKNTVISVAGNFEDEKLIELVNKYFGNWKAEELASTEFDQAIFLPNVNIKEKETEQVHMCFGFNGIEHGNNKLYSLLAVNNIFGGGMSSRLFQEIREKKGLVYSIYSYPSSYKNAGLFTIYAGMNPLHVNKVINLVEQEIKKLKESGIAKEELEKSKEQLKGNYILGLESTSSRMNSIGKSELMLGKIFSPEENLKKISDVSLESVEEVIDNIFKEGKMSFAAVGNIKKEVSKNKIIKSIM